MYYIIFVLIILLDQLTKYGAIKYLKGNQPLVIIEDFLEFSYVENFGAAFGILQNRRVFFVLVTIIV
ncbi:signal peptidase II, partial [Anaerosalibacter bizertensis]|nr:signal peptidase II [Anaerosalibacter bizertensis]